MANAGRLLAEGGAHAVKLEGAGATALMATEELVEAGVPVMGHVGLTPQSVNALGGYSHSGQGCGRGRQALGGLRRAAGRRRVRRRARVHPSRARRRAQASCSTIPTIGIGAGAGCDGQVQVFHDLLGIGEFVPRHAKRYADLSEAIRSAVAAYTDDVRSGAFPGEEQSTHVDTVTLAEAELMFAAGLSEEDDE